MDLDYAARQIAGVWKMAWNRPGWTDALDRSVDGVFRSFWAVVYAAPLVVAGAVSLRRVADRTPSPSADPLLEAPLSVVLGAQMASYLIDWAASVAALVFAVQAAGGRRRVADVIIGFNWAQVMASAAQVAPMVVLAFTGARALASLLLIVAVAFAVALHWGVIRRAAAASVPFAVGAMALLILITLVVSGLVNGAALALYALVSS
ncbi:hypothetical protein [Amphiplicatus metriothermophilus]|uniref:Yip1 domain-containing protein n=1 Tax=Amphiplicatus metriothermophilus TaxID=1519374 RepID=A0A239PK59_9PROT|nr:hypothetical protein [Amphiplicatus metriothermophilus]MBB5517467.1 hypothetical protein [Amphiplicatus metriothermophilus]SNT68198.1 hypothetical protein SAMN06297382_0697 [Amphiplicatus metriothermophilus]